MVSVQVHRPTVSLRMGTGTDYVGVKPQCSMMPSSALNPPAPSLYKVLGTHQRYKKHKIRGQDDRNSHVLEILNRGCFPQKNSRFGGKGG